MKDFLQTGRLPVQETSYSAPSPEGPLPKDQVRVLEKLMDLYQGLFLHDGYGELKVRMRFLKKGQKEILLQCGKEYRFVVDFTHPFAWEGEAAGDPRPSTHAGVAGRNGFTHLKERN
jgi:hypothetical protein